MYKLRDIDPLDQGWSLLALDQRPDLLEAIFRVSDLKTLKKFRLVCQLWNTEVLRVLEEKSFIQSSKGSLVFLLSTLNTCPAPQSFFTALEIHLTDSGLASALKDILKNYGHHLKTLRLTGDIKQTFLIRTEMDDANPPNQIVNLVYNPPNELAHIQNNVKLTSKLLRIWCPNLKSVRFHTSFLIPNCATSESAGNGNLQTSALAKINLLNSSMPSTGLGLTTIELDGYMISSLRSYCLQLLQLSPDLTRLKISFGSRTVKGDPVWGPVQTAPLFFLELQKKPEITKRLQIFSVLGVKVEGLTNSISELKFSPDKLQSLTISGSTNVSDPQFPRFVEFLHKLADFQCLERLTIVKCSCSGCEWRNWREKARWRDIEQSIPTLKHVRHLNIATNGTHGIASLSLLNKFPNLHTLEFSRVNVGHSNPDQHRDNQGGFVDFDYFFGEWVYLKLTSKYGDLLRRNCANIKNLTIHHTVFKLESLKCIKECFPNLEKLTISIRSGVRYCWEVYMECKLSLSSTLEILAGLPKLSELYVTMPAGVNYPKQEISRALKMLRAFPELRRFNLLLGSPEYSNRLPYRYKDASDRSVYESFSDLVLNRESYRFRTCTVTFVGVCCCDVSSEELKDIRKVLTSYRHSYQFNWRCHRGARVFARYGKKTHEFSPADEVKEHVSEGKKQVCEIKEPEIKEHVCCATHGRSRFEFCESRRWSTDLDATE